MFKQPLDLCQGIQDLICADKRINQEPNDLISDSILKGKQASRTRCADILRQSLEPELKFKYIKICSQQIQHPFDFKIEISFSNFYSCSSSLLDMNRVFK